jgi:hypothetical protein
MMHDDDSSHEIINLFADLEQTSFFSPVDNDFK